MCDADYGFAHKKIVSAFFTQTLPPFLKNRKVSIYPRVNVLESEVSSNEGERSEVTEPPQREKVGKA